MTCRRAITVVRERMVESALLHLSSSCIDLSILIQEREAGDVDIYRSKIVSYKERKEKKKSIPLPLKMCARILVYFTFLYSNAYTRVNKEKKKDSSPYTDEVKKEDRFFSIFTSLFHPDGIREDPTHLPDTPCWTTSTTRED